MSKNVAGSPIVLLALIGLTLASWACAAAGSPEIGLPSSVSGTHTVMGRAFFPGGIMVLVDAHLTEGRGHGTMEYSQVLSRGENSLRVQVDVACVGLFQDGTQAVVAGPVSRADGDIHGRFGAGDWWVIQIEEGGPEGDMIRSSRSDQNRALSFCQGGPVGAATLRSLDGDLSIH